MPQYVLTHEQAVQLIHHLRDEAEILLRVEALSIELTQGGFRSQRLAEHQKDLSQLVGDSVTVQQRRTQWREALACQWGCSPADVRLSRFKLQQSKMEDAVETARQKILELLARTRGTLQATQHTLGHWHAMIGAVLSQLLSDSVDAGCYTATGQKTASASLPVGIDWRS